MPGFNASQDRLTLLLGAYVADVFKPNILSPQWRPIAQKIKIIFKVLLTIDNIPGHPRAVVEIRLMMFSCLQIQSSYISPWIKESFVISSIIIEEIYFMRL